MTDPATAALLRLEVARLRAGGTRRRFDTVVHVGHLGHAHRACPVPVEMRDHLDAGTRREVVTRLLEESDHGEVSPSGRDGYSVWVSRFGEPVVQDDDLAWLAASRWAFDALGCALTGFWSVTRTGWLDVRTGERRTWKRLRV